MTEKVKKWILGTGSEKPGNNYIDLKAHKPEKNYPGRLISTGCNTLTKNLAILTSHEMKKVELKYNVKDTDHFLQKIYLMNESKKLLGKNLLFCTLDIVSMFPSIPKDLGLRVLRKHLDKRENIIFLTQCILDAVEITLDHNLTSFNGSTRRQTSGAAMGGSNSCDYADIALSELDNLINEGDFFVLHGIHGPLMFLRYRDDIFIIYDADHGID